MVQLIPVADTQPPTWRLAGELNIHHAAQARQALLDALNGWQGELLRVDLADVTETDTAGVQLLLALQRSLRERGAQLEVAACPDVVSHVSRALGLEWPAQAGGQR